MSLSVGWVEPLSSRPELGIPVQSLKTPEPKGSSSFSFTLESLFGNKVCKYAFKSSNPAWLDLKQMLYGCYPRAIGLTTKMGEMFSREVDHLQDITYNCETICLFVCCSHHLNELCNMCAVFYFACLWHFHLSLRNRAREENEDMLEKKKELLKEIIHFRE